MNLQQAVQTRASVNGYVRRRVDRDMGANRESKMHSGKSAFSNFSNNTGLVNGGKVGGVGSPSRDRLIYVMTYLIGHHVEVHVKNGSVVSGIFYATDAEKDFGIVLKMAQVIKDGSVRGQQPVPDTVKKPQTMIIPARELVQVLAKDVPLSSDEFTNEHTCERRKDLMTDSAISHSHHVEVERELERWTPDKDDPQCPGLENIFDEPWNRSWDQFETNKALFGVKSTFDEELYTTKLERGPQMREREREALRIAREIEGAETRDRHQAEERGILYNEDFDLDEESRYSAVRREGDDGRVEENENSFSDAGSTETFGGSLSSVIPRSYSDISRKDIIDEAQATSTCSSVDEDALSQIQADKDLSLSGSVDHINQLASDCISKSLSMDDESRLDEKQMKDQVDENIFVNECTKRIAHVDAQTSKSEDIELEMNMKGLSPSATAYDPSSSGQVNKHSIDGSSESAVSGKSSSANEPANSAVRPGSSTSSTSERIGPTPASSGRGLSPSSSLGSLSSEKSTLNPYAKEFKLNPNAKSFTPSASASASLRAPAPISEGSFYYTNSISAVPHMHNLPVGIGFGPSFGGHQPIYNPQGAQMQSPQPYIPPNGPMYGQQMIIGQPRPVFYMPTYQPETTFKGRNF